MKKSGAGNDNKQYQRIKSNTKRIWPCEIPVAPKSSIVVANVADDIDLSRHWMHKWPNQIKELNLIRPEQLWVSDITYIRLEKVWSYISLVTDAYLRQIIGYSLRADMSVQGYTVWHLIMPPVELDIRSKNQFQTIIRFDSGLKN